jgi:hypothetical protein
VDHITHARLEVEPVRTEDDVVAHEQARNVDGVENGDLQLRGPVDQGSLNLQPRVVTGKGGAAVGVGAEEA